MDLGAYLLPRIMKEKRERQPNWSESEKLLLLSLTRKHQAILENKGCDTMTLKRKSEAWDEIALHMNAAGYNRTKERLKQQLGRIRAVDAKKVKEALEKSLTVDEISANPTVNLSPYNCKPFICDKGQIGGTVSTVSHDETQIKIEKVVSAYDDTHKEERNNQHTSFPQELNLTMGRGDNNSRTMQQSVMHLILQNIKSINDISNLTVNEAAAVQDSPAKANFTPTLPDATNTAILSLSGGSADPVQPKMEVSPNINSELKSALLGKRCLRCCHLPEIRNPPTKKQRLRQIHVYRVAVERERLRALKIQQKRDRLLHRKDVLIQNLKIQILRNITNQNRDGNRINF